MLQGTYFVVKQSMQGKYRKGVFFSFWMNKFCHTVCCIYVLS